jgi:hypothetical protein
LLCYYFAWLSMFVLIAMVAIAEFIQGEAAVNGDSRDADTIARLYVAHGVRRYRWH